MTYKTCNTYSPQNSEGVHSTQTVCFVNRALRNCYATPPGSGGDFALASARLGTQSPAVSMAQALIIGYGNPLRGDDSLGWHAARLLTDIATTHDAEVVTCHQLMPELAQQISEVSTVVFVDAASEGPPGRFGWRRVESKAGPAALAHHVSPESLLDMAKELYGRSPQAFVVSIVGETFECGEELSPVVRAALPALVELVDNLLSGKA